MEEQAKQLLHHYFGYSEFREGQHEVIRRAVQGEDQLVLMPTGGGKSLCYQIPAMQRKGTGIVVSPLIALMKDQVDALRQNGIAAEFLNSSIDPEERRNILSKLKQGEVELLYVAPERMFAGEGQFMEILRDLSVSLFAVDEAHCISQWGHDFRPEYQKLSELKSWFPDVPVMALTATADRLTRDDIVSSLRIDHAHRFIAGFNRPNIHYYVYPREDGRRQLREFLSGKKGESGIVYSLSRNSVEELAEHLNDMGYSALPYHAGMERDTRRKHQEAFIKDDVDIIVATIAFGMGIDKPDIRFVVHMNLPKNIESYYQETGRAGRDGLPSNAVLFYSRSDWRMLRQFAEVEDNPEQTRIMVNKLNRMADFCESRRCRRQFLLSYFDDEHPGNCDSCDNCLEGVETFDATVPAQKVLSAVARLNQRYGVSHISEFLTGSRNRRIPEWQRNLKTYGVGHEFNQKEWAFYIRQMVTERWVDQTADSYPVLQLNEHSRSVLKGEVQVMLSRPPEMQQVGEREDTENTFVDEKLRGKLRYLRKDLADRQNVAPYMIFTDATLEELATVMPVSESDLLRINGLGSRKVEWYGGDIARMIRSHVKKEGIDLERHHQQLAESGVLDKNKKRKNRKGEGTTQEETLNYFQQGYSLSEIAGMRNLKVSTVETHLSELMNRGKVDPMHFISNNDLQIIRNVVEENNFQRMRPIREALDEQYSFFQIRAALIAMEREKSKTD